MTNEEIYTGLLNHDEEVFNQVVTSYSKLLWAVAASVLTPTQPQAKEDIDELVSDVFIRLWRNPKSYDPVRGTIKTYLAVMTKSMAINLLTNRKRKKEEATDDSVFSDMVTAEEMNDLDWQELYRVVMTLEEPTRSVIIKRFFCDMKPADIQKELNLSAKEVDNRLYRGKQKIKKELDYTTFINEVTGHG